MILIVQSVSDHVDLTQQLKEATILLKKSNRTPPPCFQTRNSLAALAYAKNTVPRYET